MSCGRYKELISRYVDDEVTPRQRAELLQHVQHCHDCAAWLARLRQADVLLKGVSDDGPSDRVRQMVLNSVLQAKQGPSTTQRPVSGLRPAHVTSSGWRFYASALMLRFEMTPQRIAVGAALAFISILGLAYWTNQVHPMWGYDKFGFFVARDTAQALPSPTPLAAISTGANGVGGPVAAPNTVRLEPADGTQGIAPKDPLRLRFDQPMDRASVESALTIDPPAAGAFAWDADNEVSFTPSGDGLLTGMTYTVSLTGTARSLAGTQITQGAVWSFRTRNPYAVRPLEAPGSTVAPTGTFTLVFDGPMDTAETNKAVSLRAQGEDTDLPISLAWDPSGRTLVVSPADPMPCTQVALRVGSDTRTSAGDDLGKTQEFTYTVALPEPRLRFVDGRVFTVTSQGTPTVRYEALASAEHALADVEFNIYALPGDKMSALGAQTHPWPAALPTGLPGGLEVVKSLRGNPAGADPVSEVSEQALPPLAPGTYLLTASANSQAGVLQDWQLLIVTDRLLSLIDGNVLWAAQESGKPWAGAEISLYSTSGALLGKGVTQEAGVWAPSNPVDAGLTVARDLEGHVGAMVLGDQPMQNPHADGLSAGLWTDMPSYFPGQRVQFRALLGHHSASPAADQDVSVALLNTQDTVVSVLTLKPDDAGGVSGMFDLAPGILPGAYTVRISSGSEHRDFPLSVAALPADKLGVYAVRAPDEGEEVQPSVITCTVNVMSQHGDPATAALITGTLKINGDTWASSPVTATTGTDGRASLSVPLPSWAAQYNEPGLYLEVKAQWAGSTGMDRMALNVASLRHLALGNIDMVSPSLGIAGISQPQKDGGARLRLVELAGGSPASDILVLAASQLGDRLAWSLDMSVMGGDVTLPLPARFKDGIVYLARAGDGYTRQMPIPGESDAVTLSASAPAEVTPGSSLPVTLMLKDVEGQGLSGDAVIFFRKVSGLPGRVSEPAPGWEPSLHIDASGVATATLTSPSAPGLWFVQCESTTPDGVRSSARTIVNVLPSAQVMLPPQVLSARDDTYSVVIYNPGPSPLSSAVLADGGLIASVVGGTSQGVEVAAGGWQRLQWHLRPTAIGTSFVNFSFLPGAASAGVWRLPYQADAASTNTTYASGALSGDQTVGVQVPSGMDNDVHLEIHATTSLLSALTGSVREIEARPWSTDLSTWESALSAAPSVASAYRRANRDMPPGLTVSSVGRSMALQEIYAAQHEDGGWSDNPDLRAPSSALETAGVLIALRRHSLSWTEAGEDPQPPVDTYVESKGLGFLAHASLGPLGTDPSSTQLDERARSLYALSLYGAVNGSDVRPLLSYIADSAGPALSQQGQAWLALALWQTGDTGDALAVFDRLVQTPPENAQAAAPLLEALTVMNDANRRSARPGKDSASGSASSYTPDPAIAQLYLRTLMEGRQGLGWPPDYEADAVWALSRYAASETDTALDRPSIMLNDGAVQLAAQSDNPYTFVADIAGGPLHAGTNWLKLQAAPNKLLYYSLTLRASR